MFLPRRAGATTAIDARATSPTKLLFDLGTIATWRRAFRGAGTSPNLLLSRTGLAAAQHAALYTRLSGDPRAAYVPTNLAPITILAGRCRRKRFARGQTERHASCERP